ncbi:hypothetical protein AGIG_G27351, partial [Arapaima gigas]
LHCIGCSTAAAPIVHLPLFQTRGAPWRVPDAHVVAGRVRVPGRAVGVRPASLYARRARQQLGAELPAAAGA